jgi:putative OPT family oligopeptide transporter
MTQPIISASQSVPELTFKSVFLAILLTLVLAAANAFLGLKVGVTVSASIPAAVISLGVLRLFKRNSILESTMVQTAASAGEGLTAGLAFVVPALLVLGFWSDFNYVETVVVGLIGGLLGVLYSIPIRRALINSSELRFPEGAAIGNVLKASVAEDAADLGMLIKGGIIGALITLFQTGFRVFSDGVEYWWKIRETLFGVGFGFSPALIAAGYIVGMNVGVSMFVGVIVGWIIGVPVLTHIYGIPEAAHPIQAAHILWTQHIRYMGVGTMLVGGVWTLICLMKPVVQSLKTSWLSIRSARLGGGVELPRTERDIPLTTVIWLLVALMIPTFIFSYGLLNPSSIPLSEAVRWVVSIFTIVYILVVGFAFSSISAYFAGLIGSTNSPGSGLNISVLLLLALILLAIFGIDINFLGQVTQAELSSAGYAVFITAIVSAAIVIANETIQDMKVGQIVGATPWKQQLMLMIGVCVSAMIIPLVLSLLFHAYGMAGVFPRPGMDVTQMLPAPQAGLIAAVATGTFTHHLPWGMIIAGCIIAFFAIIIDEFLKPHHLRLPVLAVGLGIYLPFDATVPVLFGGLVQFFAYRRFKIVRQRSDDKAEVDTTIALSKHRGLTLACGLVAGASLVGVILAIPFAIKKSSDALSLVGPNFTPIADLLGILATAWLCWWMFRKITERKNTRA